MSARSKVSIAALALIALYGCPGEFDVESRAFPCRAPEDCVEGYECHPTRYVCVPRGSADASVFGLDASSGMRDSGTMRRGLGATCNIDLPCDEGMCVDGVCCENACTELCHRCDLTPGSCLPVADGTDPDGECTDQEFECSQYTFGLMGTSCYAGVTMRVSNGTCSARGVCRPRGCAQLGAGVEISRCGSAECMKPDACPYGAAVADYDDPAELCNSGPSFTCTMSAGEMGCCSLLGACCPAPTCAPDVNQCM